MIDYKTIKTGENVLADNGKSWTVCGKRNYLILCHDNFGHASWFAPSELFYGENERLLANFRNSLKDLLIEAFNLELPNIQTEVQNIYKECEEFHKQINKQENGN